MQYENIFYNELRSIGKARIPEEETKEAAVLPSMPISSSNLFTHPDTHPLVLDAALIKRFKLEWFEWLTETLLEEIKREFSTNISDINRGKILAARSLHATDVFWTDWEAFEKILLSLMGIPPKWDTINPIEAPFLSVGIHIVDKIRKEEFSEEVKRYIATCLMHDGLFVAPPNLGFVQIYLTNRRYKCLECGREGPAYGRSFLGVCPDCSRAYDEDDDKPFKFEPSKKALEEGRGTHLTFSDNQDVVDKVKQKLKEGVDPNPQDPISWQAYWLVTCQRLIESYDKDLEEQLKIVKEL